MVLLMAFAVLAGTGQEGQGKQHRRGRGHHPFIDRDGDGIEDTFQHRYGRKRLRRRVEEQLPRMRELLALDETSSLQMVCRIEDIPPAYRARVRELHPDSVPSPPAQIMAEDQQIMTIYYSWTDAGNCLYRWYLLARAGEIVRLDGRRLLPPPTEESAPGFSCPPTVTWNRSATTPIQ
ncbi:MAG: hypothetical protein JXQ27_16565 [Acidobacteria bacterium]|nr:hypothetical protein [Acidobacteriota bacterium]